MKVLHVNTIDTGGAAIAAKRLHLLQLKNGIDSKMLFLKRNGNQQIPEAYYFSDLFGNTTFKLLDKLNTFYNRRFTFTRPSLYFNGPDSLFDISRHELFQWADVIHLHWVVKFLDWKKVFSHKEKAFVWTFHDMNPFTGGEHYATGYKDEFSSRSSVNIEKKNDAIKDCKIEVICPSEWLAELARHSKTFYDIPVNAIRNPIDTDVFKPLEKSASKSDKKNILFVAENPHDERKGFGLLLNALTHLHKDTFQLSVIGRKEYVENRFPAATFHGTVSLEEKMVEIYNSADLFVIPSLEDNLPNTVSEALLCGTPVVGLKIGGIAEMVENGINGFLAAEENELHQAIENGLKIEFDREKIREFALEQLDTKFILNSIKQVYEKLIT